MAGYSRQEAADRAGISLDDLGRQVEAGALTPDRADRFSAGDVRKAGLIKSLEAAGIPLDGLGELIRQGGLNLDFMDDDIYERFAALSNVTFQELSERTGVPVELLMVIREAVGSAQPTLQDRVREDELLISPFLEAQVKAGFRHTAIERLLRTTGDSLRRIAETEADWWYSEVLEPLVAQGMSPSEAANDANNNELTAISERAMLATFHAQQTHTWTANIIRGVEGELARAGLHSRLEHPPAMCFLDITGYTRLTQERGDDAAAQMAGELARLVRRSSVQHGGRPVKWLGDGVMFFFPDPGPGVMAALEMVVGAAGAGLPPAHVGLHAGPVVFQERDYFGQTVNVASRIAEYARPGEVLVSQEVVDAAQGAQASFTEIGPVELKGVAGAIHLHAAHRSA
jgi:class 3 adenylate cyclase/DNA-binding transcriptional MerR regulator